MDSFLLLARVSQNLGLHLLFAIPMTLLSVFLILVILVQRGRGGGLTGALGGMGGQSAFGTKAGDLFTRITIVVAAIWVLLSMASIKVLAQRETFDRTQTVPAATVPAGKTPSPAKGGPSSVPGATTPPASGTPMATPPAAAPASGATPEVPPAEKTQP